MTARKSSYNNSALLNSWMLMWHKPTLFFPQIFGFFLVVILGGLFYGLTELFFGSLELASTASKLFFSFIVLVFIFVGVYLISLQIRIFSQIVRDKKIYVSTAFKEAYTQYWRVCVLTLLKAIILILYSLLVFILYAITYGTSPTTLPLLVFLLVSLALTGFFIGPWLMGMEPLLAITTINAWELVQRSWKEYRRHTSYFIPRMFIILALVLISTIITTLLTESPSINSTLGSSISFIINILTGVYITTYIYVIYYAKVKDKDV